MPDYGWGDFMKVMLGGDEPPPGPPYVHRHVLPEPERVLCVQCVEPIEADERWTDLGAGPEHEDCPG